MYDVRRIYDQRRSHYYRGSHASQSAAGGADQIGATGAADTRVAPHSLPRPLTFRTHVGMRGSMKERDLRLPGGELEYAVLFSVCELGAASAREVHLQVGAAAGLAYTTIAKVLERLQAKGLVTRKRKGMAFVYRPRIARRVIEFARARVSLSKLLGPAPRPAVATLVEAMESLDPGLLDELERAVAARRRPRDGS
jgi:predicted transcriptional regulator